MKQDKEYILCAAIWYNRLTPKIVHQLTNIQSGFVLCGRKHHNIIEIGHQLAGLTLKDTDTQGFITSKNRFVDRSEAREIAFLAGQIDDKGPLGDLYSEDLY